MSVPKSEAAAAWKAVSASDRREVVRLASSGTRHPNPIVGAAAFAWSHSDVWDEIWYRAPGWVLPALGLTMLVLTVTAQLPVVLIVGSCLVIVFGLLGWNSATIVATVRGLYTEP